MNDNDKSGVIEPGNLYVAEEARRRLRIGCKAWRELRASGLEVIRRGRQAYVFGDDLLSIFERTGGPGEIATMPTPLQIELQLPAYAGLTDAQAAAALNATIVVGRQLVAMGDIKPMIYTDATPSARIRIEDAANAVLPATTDPSYAAALTLKTAAREVLAWITDPHVEHVDMDNPTTKAGMAAIVAGGVISPALAAQIDALANVTTTRPRKFGYRKPITAAMVTVARSAE